MKSPLVKANMSVASFISVVRCQPWHVLFNWHFFSKCSSPEVLRADINAEKSLGDGCWSRLTDFVSSGESC